VPVSIVSPPTTVTVVTPTIVGEAIIIDVMKFMLSITGTIATSCLGVLPLALHVPVHDTHKV
jgi:hypothetical protein